LKQTKFKAKGEEQATASGGGEAEGQVQALPPAHLTGGIEAPAGEKNMGSSIQACYTEEQQARLGVDENGEKVAAQEPAPSPPETGVGGSCFGKTKIALAGLFGPKGGKGKGGGVGGGIVAGSNALAGLFGANGGKGTSQDNHGKGDDVSAMEVGKEFIRAIESGDAKAFSALILNTLKDNVPHKTKRALRERMHLVSDCQIGESALKEAAMLLKPPEMKVNLKAGQAKWPIAADDWNNITGVQKSEAGATGVYFVEIDHKYIVVIKGIPRNEFVTDSFVLNFLRESFGISSPKLELLENTSPEYKAIKNGVRDLFLPLHDELFDQKCVTFFDGLFNQKCLSVMQFVHGSPMCHPKDGQRALHSEDLESLGSLFAFDLIIRNTDRFPCARALPRPGEAQYGNVESQGNAGNVMFDEKPGRIWAIDPELKPVSGDDQKLYLEGVAAIADEVLQRAHSKMGVRRDLLQAWKTVHPLWQSKQKLPDPLSRLQRWSEQPRRVKAVIRASLCSIRTCVELARETGEGRMLDAPPAVPDVDATATKTNILLSRLQSAMKKNEDLKAAQSEAAKAARIGELGLRLQQLKARNAVLRGDKSDVEVVSIVVGVRLEHLIMLSVCLYVGD
jgi:hypothetical protein